MPELCQFIYDGRNGGRRGALCGKPESQHCLESYEQHECPPKEKKVHHPFQRTFRCPTCGTREVRA